MTYLTQITIEIDPHTHIEGFSYRIFEVEVPLPPYVVPLEKGFIDFKTLKSKFHTNYTPLGVKHRPANALNQWYFKTPDPLSKHIRNVTSEIEEILKEKPSPTFYTIGIELVDSPPIYSTRMRDITLFFTPHLRVKI